MEQSLHLLLSRQMTLRKLWCWKKQQKNQKTDFCVRLHDFKILVTKIKSEEKLFFTVLSNLWKHSCLWGCTKGEKELRIWKQIYLSLNCCSTRQLGIVGEIHPWATTFSSSVNEGNYINLSGLSLGSEMLVPSMLLLWVLFHRSHSTIINHRH